MPNDFAIVYQDEDFVAIHKPSGVLVHRTMMDRHETRFALQMTRDATGRNVYPVHRLDKPTSGLMVFAFTSNVSRFLQEQFQQGTIEKRYTAIVRGWPKQNSWVVDRPLKYQVDKYSEKNVDENKIQSARTEFRCLAKTSIDQPLGEFPTVRYSLLQITPKTGRKHQIRRHLNACDHPIIGDTNHGDRHHNHFFRDYFGQRRLYLASIGITLIHPSTDQLVRLDTPVQDNFQQVIDQLDWQPV